VTGIMAVVAGLAAGGTHVVLGPDHLAAVLPLSVDKGRRAWAVGLSWGLGHAAGVIALVVAGQVLRDAVDIEAWSATAEGLVGFLLIGLGVAALVRAGRVVIHDHPHEHEAEDHGHVHVHVDDPTVGTAAHVDAPHGHEHSAFGFGLFHGAAGTGHLLGVLPTLALGPVTAAAYTGGYLAAAVVTMTGFGMVAGQLGTNPARMRGALGLSGVLAMAVGGFWLTV